ncbi:MAG: ABC-F family ATP-binding cassette domain-containing protein, partial [Firmicutes bacterium]|nr:ABC-F family ATP-binding cassette domain-containing protein [Bacillota bacterium]
MIISAKGITKAYGDDVILDGVSFHVSEGDRIGIVGINGAGKTTLLRILAGEMDADAGDFFMPQDLTIGYLRQNDRFRSENTVIEEATNIFSDLIDMEEEITRLNSQVSRLSEEGRYDEAEDLMITQQQIGEAYRNRGGFTYRSRITGILRSMAFDESFYDKKIYTLSGGERTRLALACLLLEKPDVLFLDEPTNHLDIGTLKWLEQYLKSYTGTMIIVS